ncbi:MAG: sigma-70 family RNA polymerase sigma factor [Actinomycetota bacterium]|nr:sigma-70 family RNA polymerase sigma factor [Actinomycetota bacterium]
MELDRLEGALVAARQGDEAAIGKLFAAFQPLLLRFLRRQAPRVAEDLAAETWLALARQLPSVVGQVADFRALLFTVARRRVVDHYRAEGRRPASRPLEASDDRSGGDDPSETVVDQLSAQQAIDQLVGGLPPAQAEVVLLRVVAGLSVEETAAVIERSPGAVRVLQHRALRRLAGQLAADGVTP